ncbi:MAG: TlpA family protein disulfide reductase [Candidatus Cryptobacteroides sp.]
MKCNLSNVLRQYDENAVIDSVAVQALSSEGNYETIGYAKVSGDEAIFRGKVPEPVLGRIKFFLSVPGGSGSSDAALIIEPGSISSDDAIVFYGSRNNDALNQAVQELDKCSEDSVAVRNLFAETAEKYSDATLVALLSNAFRKLDPGMWLRTIGQMDDAIINHPVIESCSKRANAILVAERAAKATAEGCRFADFKGEWNGREYKLSDFAGKGKYVLVDFWASWCRPCREEIPNVIRVYEKYKDKGLVVLGVAVSDRPEQTAKAVEALGINYTVVNEVGRSASDAYGIRFIPQIILIAPDGTIVAKGLTGDQIETTVQKFLSTKM